MARYTRSPTSFSDSTVLHRDDSLKIPSRLTAGAGLLAGCDPRS